MLVNVYCGRPIFGASFIKALEITTLKGLTTAEAGSSFSPTLYFRERWILQVINIISYQLLEF
jgi:hypothetical protein